MSFIYAVGSINGRERAGQTFHSTAELCCVLVIAGTQHYPPSWVEALQLAGSSGYWVGHSSERFAVGLLLVREPSLVLGSRGYSYRDRTQQIL